MGFKIWLEQVGPNNQPTLLRKDQYEQVQKLYDGAIKALGVNGAPKSVATTTLSDVQDADPNPNKPPQKGVRVVANKLQHIFNQLSQVPHFEDKVNDAQNWLQQLATAKSDDPRPNDNIATLLKKMFGDDALETYGDRKWKGATAAEPKQPDDNNMPTKDATSPPMSQDTPPQNQQPDPNMPPMDPSMGQQPDPNMPPPGGDPMGGMPPMDPSMGQQPPPNQPLPGPGGPFPKQPPGGLQMS